MDRHPHAAFNENPERYLMARQFWTALIADATGESGIVWKITKVGDCLRAGDPTCGNPIVFAVSSDRSRAIRITQEEVTSDAPEIGAWVDRMNSSIDGELFDGYELVISCELSLEAESIARFLVAEWSKRDMTARRMDELASLALADVSDDEE